jgi:hypothetical protein
MRNVLNIKGIFWKIGLERSSELNFSPHYVNLVFEKNFGTSPRRQYFAENFFGFWKFKWEGSKFFISPPPPNQKPLGTALCISLLLSNEIAL